MIGLKEKSVVISLNDAKEYAESRLIVLNQRKDQLLNELEKINIDIEMEIERLYMLDNPPLIREEDKCNREVIHIPVRELIDLDD